MMSGVSAEAITVIMLGSVFLLFLLGVPVAFALGGAAVVFGFLTIGPPSFTIIYTRIYSMLLNYGLLAVPMFVFMGSVLERTGLARDFYNALYLVLGRVPGGLAISTVLVGTALAAALGVITASVAMLTIVALPSLIAKGYSRSLATGTVCASGCLGILIPPSVMLVVYGPMAELSVGRLFMGAIGPGLLLAALYCLYIMVRCTLRPDDAPKIPIEEAAVPLGFKLKQLAVSIVPVALLILAVLGSIFFGIAPPTQAAAVGAVGAVLLALAQRSLNLQALRHIMLTTLRTSAFVYVIGSMAVAFVGVFLVNGGGQVITNLLLQAPGDRWGAFGAIMLVVFVMGMFLNWLAIMFILIPLITPMAVLLQFDPIWFAIMVCLMLQTGFLTPPMSMAIFICKGTADPELGITLTHIIRGVVPYVAIILAALMLCIGFPDIISWLPQQMF